MWSRNTVRESSHIFFFCGGDSLWVLERRSENTQDLFARVTRRSLLSLERPADLSPLLEKPTDLTSSLEKPVNLPPSLERPVDLSPSLEVQNIYIYIYIYCLFKYNAGIWTCLFANVFSVYSWLSELIYFRFFLVICWSYLRTEICHSIHMQ